MKRTGNVQWKDSESIVKIQWKYSETDSKAYSERTVKIMVKLV